MSYRQMLLDHLEEHAVCLMIRLKRSNNLETFLELQIDAAREVRDLRLGSNPSTTDRMDAEEIARSVLFDYPNDQNQV